MANAGVDGGVEFQPREYGLYVSSPQIPPRKVAS